jgi:hypothetical protein
MNFLIFWSYALIISKRLHLPLFKLIKDKGTVTINIFSTNFNKLFTKYKSLIKMLFACVHLRDFGN